ncbi:MAG: hypothetical protein HFH41_10390 [Lachnospiraceae bacterium]|nr:hypothetical protein [Lachnospiraceae bacterium]
MSKLNDILNEANTQALKDILVEIEIEKTKRIKGNLDRNDCDYTEHNGIFNRLNLQSIGCYIKEGSRSLSIDRTSFSMREQIAEKELDKKLHLKLDEETIEWLWPDIIEYTAKKEEIQFSKGMKAGAKLALLLTSDSEYDF